MAVDLLVIRGNYLLGRWARPVQVKGIKVNNSGKGKKE